MAEEGGNQGLIAVMTGDIVRSSSLAPGKLKALVTSIDVAATRFGTLYPGSVLGDADVYRGDSWQIAMARPELSLRFSLYLRARFIESGGKADTRVSIGFGSDNAIAQDRISRSTGDAFLRSGRALDEIGERRMIVAMPDAPPDTGALARCVVSLLDRLAAGWTVKQAGAMRLVLENPGKPDADIADARMSDSERRNFTKLKNRADAGLVLEVLTAFEGLSLWNSRE